MARLDVVAAHAQGSLAEVYRVRGMAADGRRYDYAARRLRGIALKPEPYSALVAAQRALVRTLHTNLVRAHGVALPDGDDDSGDVYVLTELHACRDVRAVVDAARKRGQPLPLSAALHIARAVCTALQVAQQAGQAPHGAITPECVLLCAGGDVKLADVGVTRHVLPALNTRKGPWHGPLGYGSPEQLGADGDAYGPQSDLYQVGLVLWELLAGAPLFAAADSAHPGAAGAVVEAMLKHEVPSLPKPVPAALDELVHNVLAKNPVLRPSSAEQLATELASIAKAHGAGDLAQATAAVTQLVSATPPTSTPPRQPPARLRAQELKPSAVRAEDDAHDETREMAVAPSDHTVLDARRTRGASDVKVRSDTDRNVRAPGPALPRDTDKSIPRIPDDSDETGGATQPLTQVPRDLRDDRTASADADVDDSQMETRRTTPAPPPSSEPTALPVGGKTPSSSNPPLVDDD